MLHEMQNTTNVFLNGKPLVIGHRGAGGLAPENTLAAFLKGIEVGADFLELDLQFTKDGKIVVIHDWKVNRVTNGRGRVRKMTLAQLKKLDAGYWFTPDHGATYPYRGKGITIPTLDEVLDAVGDMPLIIDCKVPALSLVERAALTLKMHGRLDQRVVFTMPKSLGPLARKVIQPALSNLSDSELNKLLVYTLLGQAKKFKMPGDLVQVPLASRHRFRLFSKRLIAACHALDRPINAWTIDDEGQMRHMLDLGVDVITTNYPDKMRRIICQRESAVRR